MKFKRKNPAKTGKKQDGRFQPGESGNPQGRTQGSRNKASIILDGLLQEQAEAILKKAINLALKGDPHMIRALLDKLIPNRKDSPVKIRLPTASGAKDLPTITAAILKATGSGKLTPSEAAALSRIIDSHKSALELFEMETRLQELERQIGGEKNEPKYR